MMEGDFTSIYALQIWWGGDALRPEHLIQIDRGAEHTGAENALELKPELQIWHDQMTKQPGYLAVRRPTVTRMNPSS
jgi:hypothetical protein